MWQRVAPAALAVAGLAGIAFGLWPRSGPVDAWVNPLASARFTRVTDFPGTETQAAISPDGRFIAFLSDRDGPMHLWLNQVGTGRFSNLTKDLPAFGFTYAVRFLGFSGDGSEIWTTSLANRTSVMPLIGGEQRPFLVASSIHPAWSPDGVALVYQNAVDGDPLFVADRSGANAREIFKDQRGIHNHNPIWSTDGQWIYFVHGSPDAEQMDVWRIRPSGGSPEQLTDHHAPVNFVASLDARTLLFVAPAEDRSGPWLWSLDVESKLTRRVTAGLEQYLTVAASADGRRIVATVANPSARLWSLPIVERVADERDVRPFPVPSVRALGPRFRGASLFYLSSRGAGDGLWRVEDGQASEIWKGSDGALGQPASVSRDGRRVAIVLRKGGKGHLTIMAADGSDSRDVASSIDVQGVTDWAPDGTSIVTGGIDAQGAGLFIIPVNGGTAARLTKGIGSNPAWSPDGSLIVYAGPNVAGQQLLLGVQPDGTAVALPPMYVPSASRAASHRFLPDGTGLVYMNWQKANREFWVLNLATKTTRQIANLTAPDEIRNFDITPDGKQIVFDRLRENSDIVLIERP